jgi:hypothetical protein
VIQIQSSIRVVNGSQVFTEMFMSNSKAKFFFFQEIVYSQFVPEGQAVNQIFYLLKTVHKKCSNHWTFSPR